MELKWELLERPIYKGTIRARGPKIGDCTYPDQSWVFYEIAKDHTCSFRITMFLGNCGWSIDKHALYETEEQAKEVCQKHLDETFSR